MDIFTYIAYFLGIIIATLLVFLVSENLFWNIMSVIYRFHMFMLIKNSDNFWLTGLLFMGYIYNLIFFLLIHYQNKYSIHSPSCHNLGEIYNKSYCCYPTKFISIIAVIGYGIQGFCYGYYVVYSNKIFGFLK